jgi:hypothetical protein
MTIKELNILHDKAKNRKDGIYSYKGNLWVVKNNHFIAYAKPNGECMQRMGAFDFKIGEVKPYERKEKLKEWLKKQK